MREEASPVCADVNICGRGHPTIAWPDSETAITGLYHRVRDVLTH
jgi:hypothetical protein